MNDTRTGEGITRLRNRFLRRAAYLGAHQDFLDTIKSARQWWNTRFEYYRVKSSATRRVEPPEALVDDLSPPPPARTRALDLDDWSLPSTKASLAMDHWTRNVSKIAQYYWPPLDFPHPFSPDRHPASAFITAHFYIERFESGYGIEDDDEIEELFPPFVLRPEPMLSERGEWAVEHLDAHAREVLGWCLPLYPDMTAADFEAESGRLAEWVHDIYESRSAAARMRALLSEGYTRQQIADRLGIHEKAVKRALLGLPRGNGRKR